MTRSIHFISLGCPKNRVDTEVMLGVSADEGVTLVGDPSDADVIVVNTCGFIGAAKEESIDTILEMSRYREAGSCSKLVVTGCLSQRYPEELAEEMPEVDHFLGSSDGFRLRDVLQGTEERLLVGNPADFLMRASDPRRLSLRSHSAYVKIAEGCNRTCSFCAIPAIRGKQRSRSIADVVREVERLASEGTVEVNLVSQDTIGYGRDLKDRPRLAELTRAVADVDGIRWVRLHYLYPEALRPDLLDVISGLPKVLPYIDMPLQHAADAMLRRMRRGHGGDRLYQVVERLRRQLPDDMVFRTTFIVGHPGETDQDFEDLLTFVRWAEFDHVGVFLYSHEEGTKSGEMDDLVSDRVARQRRKRLMAVQRRISRKKLRARVGTRVEVLVDGVSAESDLLLEGRWWGQAPEVDGKVHLANGEARPGELRVAEVTGAADYDLVADLVAADGTVDVPPGARSRRVRLPTL